MWDASTGTEQRLLGGHKGLIWRLAISPDGKMAASASMDGTVKLWDLGTSELLATFAGRSDMPRSTAFSPDGKVLAVGTEDGALEFWDVVARKRRLTLPAHFAPAVALAYSPDGKLLASGAGWSTSKGPGCVTLWDVTLEPPQPIFTAPHTHDAAFSPDSKLLATCGSQGATVWSVPSGERTATFESRHSTVISLAFSPDGTRWSSAVTTGTSSCGNLQRGRRAPLACISARFTMSRTFPQGDLVASAGDDGAVKLWHTALHEDVTTFTHDKGIRCLAFTPDSKRLVVGSASTTQLLDAATGKKTIALPVGQVVHAASADADLLAAWGTDGKCTIWDVAAERVQTVLPIGSNLAGASFSRDGKTLVAWTDDAEGAGRVRLWDLDTSRVRFALKVDGFGKIFGAAFSPDGAALATCAQFGVVSFWDCATGQMRMTLQRSEGPTTSAHGIAFSNDGKLLATGNSEGLLRVWDVETGRLKASFKGHAESITVAAFSPDGKTLLSGSHDKTARLWDVATGQELLALKDHKSPVHLVAFAPDGNQIATASHNVVKLWFAATEPEATAFKQELDPNDAGSPRAAILWGDRLQEINRPQEAAIAYGMARDRLEKLAAALPEVPEYREELAYALLAPSMMTDPAPSLSKTHRRFDELWPTIPVDRQLQFLDALNVKGVARANENRLDRSIPIFEETVRLNRATRPDDAATFRSIANLGVIYWRAGRKPEGTRLLEEALAWAGKQPVPVASQFAWAADALALCYELEKQYAKAERLLREFLQRIEQQPGDAGTPTARLPAALGRNLLKQEKYAEAEATLREALRLEPRHPSALGLLNQALAGQGKPPQQPPPAPPVVKSPQELAQERLNEAQSLRQQKKYAEAEAALREAARLNPSWPTIHAVLGWTLREQRKNAEAELAFRQALRLVPESAHAHSGLGWALYDQGKFAEAAAAAGEAVRLEPTNGRNHQLLGWALLHSREFSEGELAFREGVRLKPDDAVGYHGLGCALFRQKKHHEAVEALRAALRLGFTDHRVHDILGWALVEDGQHAEAETAFREVVRLQPDLASGYFGLGRALVEQKKFADAEAVLRETLKREPSHPWAGMLLDQALVGQGKSAETKEKQENSSQED